MEAFYAVFNWIDKNILWGIPMIVLILGCGIFLTFRTRALQIRKFGFAFKNTFVDSIKQIGKKDKASNGKNISAFEAFITAISGTVGTGNIVGVTTAILYGGPGAVFWMWISAFFGCITKFSEITLGLYFRKKDKQGEYIGGPMHYIENGTKAKWLAILFAVFTMLAAIGMGSVQVDTIQNTWETSMSIPTWITAIVVVFVAGLVILGGVKRISKVASLLVPFMAIIFIIMALILIFVNVTAVPAALGSIFSSAFSTNSMLGGFAGYGIAQAMRYGFARGVFSNEAGLGSSSIAHSTSSTKEPVKQGLFGVVEVFLDTFIICTLTALFVLTSGYDGSDLNANGTSVVMGAFTNVFGSFGSAIFSFILPLFAFTPILAWGIYGCKSAQYIFNKNQQKSKNIFNIVYLILILGICLTTSFLGENIASDFVWLLSDMTNALMAIPNLIALFLLSGTIVKLTKNYFDRKNGIKVAPMISAYEEYNILEDNDENSKDTKQTQVENNEVDLSNKQKSREEIHEQKIQSEKEKKVTKKTSSKKIEKSENKTKTTKKRN